MAWGHDDTGELLIPLPRGRYVVSVGSEKHQDNVAWSFKVGKRPTDLGRITLKTLLLVRLQGTPAPEIHATSARGVPASITLADLRGRWILIDFWGTWCGPCVRGMPELMRFWDNHVEFRDRFEILAFHDSTVKTLEDLETKLRPIKDEFWEGHPPPFPVLMDNTGMTLRRYGISGFPTLVLIDPQGNIVDSTVGDGSRLLERLTQELQGPAAIQ